MYDEYMIKFDKITTRGGDSGKTSIMGGSRLSKDDLVIDVLGEIDELHAALGMFKASLETPLECDEIEWIQNTLIRMGAMVAVAPSHPYYEKLDRVCEEDVDKLEKWQKEMMNQVTLPQKFITYGASEQGARADMARAICRRNERRIVSLIRKRAMKELIDSQIFLNRLSDYLFIYARKLDARYQ